MKGFILTYKETGEKRGYTTLSALFEENSRVDIGVSKSTLDKYDFSQPYENSKCTIEVLIFKTRGDIIREREQFL